ncbi:hypothetical protein NC652_018639 [Populus alba x Populus x berolinensis]|uniref:Uncharacterized protein n=1 Tax=Populus alba x Populus x berolinensis TaxID=444605 RepID=A0AAD6VVM2_9ROSI|nr:hypothetical protein NC652_018639 [Populus alba x Populus x berolinensis]KAJ6990016.1 hypothetical protein NC653_018513 [Populus alba x Populus x berolinensis]
MIGTAQMKMLINNGDDYQLMVIIIRQLVESMCLSHEQKLMCMDGMVSLLVYSSADDCYSDLHPRNSATACRSDINVIFRD